MDDQNELKVLVKKSDGTFVHVPLSDLKNKNENQTAVTKSTPQTLSASAPKQPSPPANLPVGDIAQTQIKKSDIQPKFDEKESARLEKEIPALIPEKSKIPKEQNAAQPANSKSTIKFGFTKLTETAPKIAPTPLVKAEKEDFESLLEEKLPDSSKIISLVSSGREKQVESVLKALSFKVPVESGSRLKTVIQLFLKEVRGESETIEILRRREIEGGLGLSADEAKEVIDKSKKSVLNETTGSVPVLKEKKLFTELTPSLEKKSNLTANCGLSVSENDRLESELPALVKNTPTAINSVKVLPKIAPETGRTAPVQPVMSKPVVSESKKILDDQITRASLSEEPVESFKVSPDQIKPTMFDVRKDPISMGPVDEIRSFSLVDFRRLSTDPTEAAGRLKQKLLNLREESIVLYFEGWQAWKDSPLYHDYMNVVAEAIAKRMPLAKVTAERSKIQLSEISALVRMEKQLG